MSRILLRELDPTGSFKVSGSSEVKGKSDIISSKNSDYAFKVSGSVSKFLNDIVVNSESTGSSNMEVHGDGNKDIFSLKLIEGGTEKEKLKVNDEGVLILGDFDNLPTPEKGGLIYSGSNLFLGVD